MVTSEDARYILSEIRQMPYYEQRIAFLRYELAEIDNAISALTEPASPNGGTDIKVGGTEVRVKVAGGGVSKEALLADYITSQAPLEDQLADFTRRYKKAAGYKKRLAESKHGDFARDFLSGKKTYKDIESEYFVSNAYDRMIRVIMQNIENV